MVKFLGFGVPSLAVTLSVISTSAVAYVLPPPPPTPPPEIDPHPEFGFLVPYIAGRVGSEEEQLPIGEVVPDDFCLDYKADSCGDHLRDQDLSPFASDAERAARADEEENWGFWARGNGRQTIWTDAGQEKTTATFSIGADRSFGESAAFGLMAMILQEETTIDTPQTEDRATGVLAGPYFLLGSGEINIDGRFLFGVANHDVYTLGTQTGQYRSDRSLIALRASTEVERENWLLYPSLEIANLNTRSTAYVDTVAGNVAASTSRETFLTLGGMGYYTGLGGDTWDFAPYVGLYGHFDIENSSLFGSARVGMIHSLDNGGSIYLEYVHGAIGLDGIDDRQVSVGFEMKF